jgi:hypothetical protein
MPSAARNGIEKATAARAFGADYVTIRGVIDVRAAREAIRLCTSSVIQEQSGQSTWRQTSQSL